MRCMTRDEFDTTKWYKGIKVRERGKKESYFVDAVIFSEYTISFWEEGKYRVLPCEYLEIVEK